MKYQVPSIRLLLPFCQTLKEAYFGVNEERLSFIKLYARLIKFTKQLPIALRERVLFSACLFEWLEIENKYRFLSPTRSTLYVLIRNYFKLEIHPLTLDDQLIFLGNFYDFVLNNLDSDSVEDLFWVKKENLLNSIKKNILIILNKEAEDIKHLLEEPPISSALEKNIDGLLEEYKKILDARWFPNAERRALLKFLETIHTSCHLTDLAENAAYLQVDFLRHVRLGLILFALIKINKEYKIFTTKRKEIYGNTLFGSTFFEKALSVINIKHLDQLDGHTKIAWLRALSMHIKNIKSQLPDQMASFEKEVDTFLMQQEMLINKPSYMKQCLSSVFSYAAQYGLTFTVTQFAAQAALPALETAILGSVTGPVGIVVYGTAGTIIASQLSQLLKDKIIPAALAGIYAKILTKIGEVIGQTTSNIIALTFDTSVEGLNHLLNFYLNIQSQEELEKDKEWIMTLLNLPDDLFSKEKKEIIQNIKDIPNEKIECIGFLLKPS